ncbi:bifunctional epoxide hydrolase 2-like [Herrania umbratica]|uniref:Bifunctional epoxide hydrolase 2-like n=1 Tax=Herrania umbratica TaxID=108875 RepID=A0A6J1AGY8_9ROSI|nr:bifunctional epoxide hydrolase 2-like [Herrania umbratica]
MDKIQHSHVQAKGLKLHVAEIGTGPKVVVFLHGFPEIWYSWRHQMIAVANAGYRAISVDFRGYGLSEHPSEPEKATFNDFVDDVVALLDSLGITKAHIVAKDFGAFVAAMLAILYPDRVSSIVLLGVPFLLPGLSPLQSQLPLIPPGFYMLRWMIPGKAEADFARFDAKTVIRKVYIMFSGSLPPVAADNQEIMDLVDSSAPLPPWFSEEELAEYGSLYEKCGFRTALQVPYRTMMVPCGLDDRKITAPGLVIVGEKDYIMKFPGLEDYIRSGKIKESVPNLDVTFMSEGNHFVQEQAPEEVNQLIISFLNKHCE